MRVEPHHTADELGSLTRAEPEARVARRLMAVPSALLGPRPSAVCPASGRAEGLIRPVPNTGVLPSFLDQLSATIPVGTHACGCGPGTTRRADPSARRRT